MTTTSSHKCSTQQSYRVSRLVRPLNVAVFSELSPMSFRYLYTQVNQLMPHTSTNHTYSDVSFDSPLKIMLGSAVMGLPWKLLQAGSKTTHYIALKINSSCSDNYTTSVSIIQRVKIAQSAEQLRFQGQQPHIIKLDCLQQQQVCEQARRQH